MKRILATLLSVALVLSMMIVPAAAEGVEADIVIIGAGGAGLSAAIEAVEKLPEKVMRQIDVLIYKQQRFLVIHIMNPVGEQLTFEDGLPVTTKSNKNFHGFGMRSMQYIVKKYDGFLTASQEDGCFSLKILIPIAE